MRVHYSLYGRLLNKSLLHEAYKQVAICKGAAGIDRQSLRDFAQDVEGNLNRLLLELQGKRYQAQPVRRVVIPKDDGGVRLLGIPFVRSRPNSPTSPTDVVATDIRGRLSPEQLWVPSTSKLS